MREKIKGGMPFYMIQLDYITENNVAKATQLLCNRFVFRGDRCHLEDRLFFQIAYAGDTFDSIANEDEKEGKIATEPEVALQVIHFLGKRPIVVGNTLGLHYLNDAARRHYLSFSGVKPELIMVEKSTAPSMHQRVREEYFAFLHWLNEETWTYQVKLINVRYWQPRRQISPERLYIETTPQVPQLYYDIGKGIWNITEPGLDVENLVKQMKQKAECQLMDEFVKKMRKIRVLIQEVPLQS